MFSGKNKCAIIDQKKELLLRDEFESLDKAVIVTNDMKKAPPEIPAGLFPA